MEEITIVGLDLAKHVFQVHAARQDGTVVLRKKLPRSKVSGPSIPPIGPAQVMA